MPITVYSNHVTMAVTDRDVVLTFDWDSQSESVVQVYLLRSGFTKLVHKLMRQLARETKGVRFMAKLKSAKTPLRPWSGKPGKRVSGNRPAAPVKSK